MQPQVMHEVVVLLARRVGPDVLAAVLDGTFPGFTLLFSDLLPVRLVQRGCIACGISPGVLRQIRCCFQPAGYFFTPTPEAFSDLIGHVDTSETFIL